MTGELESPREHVPIFDGESILIKGWVGGPRRPLGLVLDGNQVGKIIPQKPRPEIAVAHGFTDDKVGFELPFKAANAMGTHSVALLDLSDGSRKLFETKFTIYSKDVLPRHPFYVVTHERAGTHFLLNTLARNTVVRSEPTGVPEWFGPYDQPETRIAPLKYVHENWDAAGLVCSMIKTHADYPLFKRHYHPSKSLFVVRDPRDTLTSFYHYLNSDSFHTNNPLAGDQRCASFAEFLRRPLTPFLKWCYSLNGDAENVVQRWALHSAGWLAAPETLTIRYEDLKADFETVLNNATKFLNLKRQPSSKSIGLHDAPSVMPRKGIVGDWKSLFTDDDEAFVRKVCDDAGVDWARVTA